MISNKQELQDELLRQWQPYGPVAAFWAGQLFLAMVEFDRVMTLYTALAASLDEAALVAPNDYVPEDSRWHHGLFTAFYNHTKEIRILLRLSDQATRRVNQIQRQLNAIKKEAPKPAPQQEAQSDGGLQPAPQPETKANYDSGLRLVRLPAKADPPLNGQNRFAGRRN